MKKFMTDIDMLGNSINGNVAPGFVLLGDDDVVPEGLPAGSLIVRVTGLVPDNPEVPDFGVRDVVTSRSASASSLSFTSLPDYEPGDLLLASVTYQYDKWDWSIPSGWELIHEANGNNASRGTAIFGFPVTDETANPGSSVTFGFLSSATSGRWAGSICSVSGVDLDDPVINKHNPTGSSGATLNFPTLNVGGASEAAVFVLGNAQVTSPNVSLPVTWSETGGEAVAQVESSDSTAVTRTTCSTFFKVVNGNVVGSALTWPSTPSALYGFAVVLRKAS